jgi:hypothetical protein
MQESGCRPAQSYHMSSVVQMPTPDPRLNSNQTSAPSFCRVSRYLAIEMSYKGMCVRLYRFRGKSGGDEGVKKRHGNHPIVGVGELFRGKERGLRHSGDIPRLAIRSRYIHAYTYINAHL